MSPWAHEATIKATEESRNGAGGKHGGSFSWWIIEDTGWWGWNDDIISQTGDMKVSLESKHDKNGNLGSGCQCCLRLWKNQAPGGAGRSECCWVLVEGTSVGIGHLCKVSREVTAAEMGGKGMVVGDFCSLSRRKRPSIRKKLGGGSQRLWVRYVPAAQGGYGLFTLERLASLLPTEKVTHQEC